jgi:hypothetical protein
MHSRRGSLNPRFGYACRANSLSTHRIYIPSLLTYDLIFIIKQYYPASIVFYGPGDRGGQSLLLFCLFLLSSFDSISPVAIGTSSIPLL